MTTENEVDVEKFEKAFDIMLEANPMTPQDILKVVVEKFEKISAEALFAIITYSYNIGGVATIAYINQTAEAMQKQTESESPSYIG